MEMCLSFFWGPKEKVGKFFFLVGHDFLAKKRLEKKLGPHFLGPKMAIFGKKHQKTLKNH